MTDKTISDYPSASTLQDADELLVVQNGDYKKASGAVVKSGVAPSQATQTAAGILEIASTTEAQSRTEDSRAMTSRAVQDWADGGIVLDGATDGDMGDGSLNANALFVNGQSVSGGAGMTLIESASPTSGNLVEFTSIPATYSALFLTYDDIHFNSTTRLSITCGAGTNNGSAYGKIIEGTTLTSGNITSLTGQTSDFAASRSASGSVRLDGCALAGDTNTINTSGVNYGQKQFRAECSQTVRSNGSIEEYYSLFGAINLTAGNHTLAIDYIRIAPNNSLRTFVGGTIRLYGIK